MDADRGSPHRPRASRSDRRPTGELSVGLGHESGAALVSGGDDADALVAEGIQDAQEGSPGTVKAYRTPALQRFGDQPTDGSWPGNRWLPAARRPWSARSLASATSSGSTAAGASA